MLSVSFAVTGNFKSEESCHCFINTEKFLVVTLYIESKEQNLNNLVIIQFKENLNLNAFLIVSDKSFLYATITIPFSVFSEFTTVFSLNQKRKSKHSDVIG